MWCPAESALGCFRQFFPRVLGPQFLSPQRTPAPRILFIPGPGDFCPVFFPERPPWRFWISREEIFLWIIIISPNFFLLEAYNICRWVSGDLAGPCRSLGVSTRESVCKLVNRWVGWSVRRGICQCVSEGVSTSVGESTGRWVGLWICRSVTVGRFVDL